MIAPKQKRYGIDHPLVVVNDHASVLERYIRMGFLPSPVSYHPWGTVTSLMMFPNNFIELIGVDDPEKFGTNSVDGFCFGRQLDSFLSRDQEGIYLVALHSKDADGDYAELTGRGLEGQGRIDFRRKMKLPDGTPDEAVVSLGLFIDSHLPDAPNFICQQHKPELIWVPEWQNHPNGVNGITAVTYLAEPQELIERWRAIYSEENVSFDGEVLIADTGCGVFRAMNAEAIQKYYPGISLPKGKSHHPHGVAISMSTTSPGELKRILQTQNTPFNEFDNKILVAPEWTGNVIFEFHACN